MDEFKEEREALKNASFKAKFGYFLDYYKSVYRKSQYFIIFLTMKKTGCNIFL